MTAFPMHEWETFYVIVGSSAAALTGLQFVVIALIADAGLPQSGQSLSAFGTPTVVHFCAVLLIASICSIPIASPAGFRACIILAGIAGVLYVTTVAFRARKQQEYQPVFEDWLWHVALPMLAYAALTVAGIITQWYVIAAAALLLLYIGIHNAWDTAVYISASRRRRDAP